MSNAVETALEQDAMRASDSGEKVLCFVRTTLWNSAGMKSANLSGKRLDPRVGPLAFHWPENG